MEIQEMVKTNQKARQTIQKISENIDFEKYTIKSLPRMKEKYILEMFGDDNRYTVYVKPGTYAMSSKKIESLITIAEIQKYYQCNPVKFIDDFFNIELLDSQAYIVQRAWMCPNVLLVCSRG